MKGSALNKSGNPANNAVTQPLMAHYFYLLAENDIPLKQIKQIFSQNYNMTACRNEIALDDTVFPLYKAFCADITDGLKADFLYSIHGNVKILALLWHAEPQSVTSTDFDFVSINEKIKNNLEGLIGEASVEITNTVDAGNLLEWETDYGNLYHNIPGLRDDRHHYFLSTASKKEKTVDELLLSVMPELALQINKLCKETIFYEDRRKALIKEKAEIDKSINESLHKQMVSRNKDENYRKELEEEAGRLSGYYAILSNSLLMIMESVTALYNDLERLSEIFEQNNNSEDLPPLFAHYKNRFGKKINDLERDAASMQKSVDNARAAIELVQTKAELFRGNETMALQVQTKELLDQNIEVQHELVALQVAAGVVEFVLIFYYSIKSWESIIPDHATDYLNPFIKILIVGGFSGSVVTLTHFVAQAVKQKKIRKGAVITFSLVILALISMFVASYFAIKFKKS